jgi:hypothetical protein
MEDGGKVLGVRLVNCSMVILVGEVERDGDPVRSRMEFRI